MENICIIMEGDLLGIQDQRQESPLWPPGELEDPVAALPKKLEVSEWQESRMQGQSVNSWRVADVSPS